MEGVRKLARSQSIKLCEKLKIPVGRVERSTSKEDERMEEEGEGDSATPTQLPILRSFHSTTKELSEKNKTNGVSSDCRGLVQYEDMLTLLTCLHCAQLVRPPVAQCRKGHLYCSSCKAAHHLVSCRICKQTFVDAPNQALERMVTLIGLPCKYGDRGCPEVVFLPSRLQHETLCKFRPMPCQFQVHGCQAVFAYKDLCWHHKMCQFAHHPHPNVLPAMPERKKAAKECGSPKEEETANSGGCPGAPNISPTTPLDAPAVLEVSGSP